MLIVDAHQDLAWNILSFGRDYTLSVEETRKAEVGSKTIAVNDDTLLGWPEYLRGQVAIIFATLFAPPIRFCTREWDKVCYANTQEANNLYHEQIDIYHRLVDEHPEKFQLILEKQDLLNLPDIWNLNLQQESVGQVGDNQKPVSLVVLMEGAECISKLEELESWWHDGVRIIGPAWSSTRFCGGTGEPGPLTKEGYALLESMAELGFSLDLSHMDEEALLQALDFFPGQILASHSNALRLLKGSESNRHLSDRAIQGIIDRNGIIGVIPSNCFLKHGWRKGDPREEVTLLQVVAQIDYICQMSGNADHVGIGTDFDGGFGLQSVPKEINSIADLQKLPPLLMEKGYGSEDIAAIMGMNWFSLLQQTLPG